jgi:membrane protease YdiL (CAAX protease family)
VRSILFRDIELSTTFEINLIRAMNGVVGVGLVYIFLMFDRRKLNVVGFEWNSKWGIEWILLGIPIALAGLIPTVIFELFFEIVEFVGLLDPLGILITLIVTQLAIGLGEELLFRGYIQSMLETRYSFEFAAVVSAFLFGLLHFWLASSHRSVYPMIAILFSAFVIGLTFSYTYKVTKYNLIFPVAIHGFWDFFLFIFQADFVYHDWIQVIIEILASIVGACIIFICVYAYVEKRIKPSQSL